MELDKFMAAHPRQFPVKGQTPFVKLLMEMGLHVIWHIRNPQSRVYSCHSASHRGLPRIDLGLCNEEMLPLISTSRYEPRMVSDHSPFWAQIIVAGPPSYWKINPFWLLFPDPEMQSLTDFISINQKTADKDVLGHP